MTCPAPAKKHSKSPTPELEPQAASSLEAAGAGLVASAFFLGGCQVVGAIWSDPLTPTAFLPAALLLFGLSSLLISPLPEALMGPHEGGLELRRRRWWGDALARAGSVLVMVNLPLVAYMALIATLARLEQGTVLAVVLGVNLTALLAGRLISRGTPRAALEPPPVRSLRLVSTALATRQARCPFCACDLSPEEAVSCRSCETAHHADCWQDFGRCAVFACGDFRAYHLDGRVAP